MYLDVFVYFCTIKQMQSCSVNEGKSECSKTLLKAMNQ